MKAKKRFGQNFLIDQNYINKIVGSLNCRPEDSIIEIGAGQGALTEQLVHLSSNVTAIEIDRDLQPILLEKFGDLENFKLLEKDVLHVDFREFKPKNGGKLKLVANLPYYISTAILQKLIDQRECFSEMILMFQREVVERITAKAGNKERGFITVLAEAYLETEKLFDVPPNAFSPVPKVWSSVMRLITKKESDIEVSDENLFREIVSLSFRQKRKTILNNLKNADANLTQKFEKKGGLDKIFEKVEIESKRRAESLEISEWQHLIKYISENE